MHEQDNSGVDLLLLKLDAERSVFARDEIRRELAFFLNHLLLNDFNRLVQILYCLDIDENLLKATLVKGSDCDAGLLIADLIIARQEEKKKTREESTPKELDPGEEACGP